MTAHIRFWHDRSARFKVPCQLLGKVWGEGASFGTHTVHDADAAMQRVHADEGTSFKGCRPYSGFVVNDSERNL